MCWAAQPSASYYYFMYIKVQHNCGTFVYHFILSTVYTLHTRTYVRWLHVRTYVRMYVDCMYVRTYVCTLIACTYVRTYVQHTYIRTKLAYSTYNVTIQCTYICTNLLHIRMYVCVYLRILTCWMDLMVDVLVEAAYTYMNMYWMSSY